MHSYCWTDEIYIESTEIIVITLSQVCRNKFTKSSHLQVKAEDLERF